MSAVGSSTDGAGNQPEVQFTATFTFTEVDSPHKWSCKDAITQSDGVSYCKLCRSERSLAKFISQQSASESLTSHSGFESLIIERNETHLSLAEGARPKMPEAADQSILRAMAVNFEDSDDQPETKKRRKGKPPTVEPHLKGRELPFKCDGSGEAMVIRLRGVDVTVLRPSKASEPVCVRVSDVHKVVAYLRTFKDCSFARAQKYNWAGKYAKKHIDYEEEGEDEAVEIDAQDKNASSLATQSASATGNAAATRGSGAGWGK